MIVKNRAFALAAVKTDAYYGPMYNKLSIKDETFICDFVKRTMEMSFDAYSDEVRDLFIGMKERPKTWAKIDEILMAINEKARNGKG